MLWILTSSSGVLSFPLVLCECSSVLEGGGALWHDAMPTAGELSPSGLAGRKKQREGASRHPEKGLGRPQSSSKPPNNSLVVVTCLGDYLKPLQHELGNKAPVVFSVIPKKILLVFNR